MKLIIVPYTAKRKKSHTVTDFAGHSQLSSVVTQSQTIFGWSQIVAQVAALSTMCIDGFHSIFLLWQLEGKGSCDVDIDQSASSMVI